MSGYTAPLSVALPEVTLRKTRCLPCDGEVLVKLGDLVRPADIIARGQRPAEPVVVMVGQALGVRAPEVTRLLKRWAGENVQENEVLAERKGVAGMGKRVCRSPIDGVVISGPHSGGEVVIGRGEEDVTTYAGLPGRVVAILPSRGAVIETTATYVTGIGGYGAEVAAVLQPAVDHPGGEITAAAINEGSGGTVLVGGYVGKDALLKAARANVAGLVVGGISGAGYHWLIANRPPLTVMVTEGGGALSLAPATFELLQACAGATGLLNGTPSPDANAELVVPVPGLSQAGGPPRPELNLGAAVRVEAGRWAGQRGRVTALPVAPRRLPSGITASILELELSDGNAVAVARSNVTLVV